jgi:S1-C subfamily serine protease
MRLATSLWVKVDGDDFPYLSLGATGNVRQGETVIAIGNPGDAMPVRRN